MSRRVPETFSGASLWQSRFLSVQKLWAFIQRDRLTLRPVLAVLVNVPNGDPAKVARHLQGYASLPSDLAAQLYEFFHATDGPLDKRRGDVVELVTWHHGPFWISRHGEALHKWHDARYRGLPGEQKTVDVAFQVQSRCEAVECKVSVTNWVKKDSKAPAKITFMNQVRVSMANDTVITQHWVGYATAEDSVAPSVQDTLGGLILTAEDLAR